MEECLGKYKVEQTPRAKGCCGKVYAGINTGSGLKVAIKELSNQKLAEREYRVMANYGKCEFLPRAYDFFVVNPKAYVVMELVEGQMLGNCLAQIRADGRKGIVLIIMDILRGLRYLHKAGYLHGDLHPWNILICGNGVFRLKIVDFGTATKKLDDGCWLGKRRGGAVGFISPEHTEDYSLLDDSSDLYMVGGLCYFLLTGRAPFSTFERHLVKCDFGDLVLNNILIKSMHSCRWKRFRSAQEFIDALRPLAK